MLRRLKYNLGEQKEELTEMELGDLCRCCVRLELVSGPVTLPQPCKQPRAGIAPRTSLPCAAVRCACPRGPPHRDFENRHPKNTGVGSRGRGRAQKVLSPFTPLAVLGEQLDLMIVPLASAFQ